MNQLSLFITQSIVTLLIYCLSPIYIGAATPKNIIHFYFTKQVITNTNEEKVVYEPTSLKKLFKEIDFKNFSVYPYISTVTIKREPLPYRSYTVVDEIEDEHGKKITKTRVSKQIDIDKFRRRGSSTNKVEGKPLTELFVKNHQIGKHKGSVVFLIELPRVPEKEDQLFYDFQVSKYWKEVAACFNLENQGDLKNMPIYFYPQGYYGKKIDISSDTSSAILKQYLINYYQIFGEPIKSKNDETIAYGGILYDQQTADFFKLFLLDVKKNTNQTNKYTLKKYNIVSLNNNLFNKIAKELKPEWINTSGKKLPPAITFAQASEQTAPQSVVQDEKNKKVKNKQRMQKFFFICFIMIGVIGGITLIFWEEIKTLFLSKKIRFEQDK